MGRGGEGRGEGDWRQIGTGDPQVYCTEHLVNTTTLAQLQNPVWLTPLHYLTYKTDQLQDGESGEGGGGGWVCVWRGGGGVDRKKGRLGD